MSHLMTSLFPMHAAVAMAAEAKAKEDKACGAHGVTRPTWNTDLPDSDVLVMVRLASAEYPVEIGFHDGEGWRTEANRRINTPVVGWLHLDEVVTRLDGGVL